MISGFLFLANVARMTLHPHRGLQGSTAPLPCSYITLFTSINAGLSLKYVLPKPVFCRLWFFFAIIVIYLVSPLVRIKTSAGKMLLA